MDKSKLVNLIKQAKIPKFHNFSTKIFQILPAQKKRKRTEKIFNSWSVWQHCTDVSFGAKFLKNKNENLNFWKKKEGKKEIK